MAAGVSEMTGASLSVTVTVKLEVGRVASDVRGCERHRGGAYSQTCRATGVRAEVSVAEQLSAGRRIGPRRRGAAGSGSRNGLRDVRRRATQSRGNVVLHRYREGHGGCIAAGMSVAEKSTSLAPRSSQSNPVWLTVVEAMPHGSLEPLSA